MAEETANKATAASDKMTREQALSYAARAERAVLDAAVAVCWEQWRSLGAFATSHGPHPAQSIVDPEALVLLTLLVRERERRLDDFLGWWAQVGSSLLSVQRAQNLAKRLPERAAERLGAFARLAAAAGDRRWKRHQSEGETPALSPRSGKGAAVPATHAAPALMLRLRAGLGVGAKADLLAFLLGLHGDRATTREAAEALGYTEVAVRTAAQEMALAGFVEETYDRPVLYSANPDAWGALLGAPSTNAPGASMARWRYWAGLFAFLADVGAWVEEGKGAEWSAYVWSSRARDLAERHRQPLDAVRLRVPEPKHYRGSRYLPAFVETVEEVAQWAEHHL